MNNNLPVDPSRVISVMNRRLGDEMQRSCVLQAALDESQATIQQLQAQVRELQNQLQHGVVASEYAEAERER